MVLFNLNEDAIRFVLKPKVYIFLHFFFLPLTRNNNYTIMSISETPRIRFEIKEEDDDVSALPMYLKPFALLPVLVKENESVLTENYHTPTCTTETKEDVDRLFQEKFLKQFNPMLWRPKQTNDRDTLWEEALKVQQINPKVDPIVYYKLKLGLFQPDRCTNAPCQVREINDEAYEVLCTSNDDLRVLPIELADGQSLQNLFDDDDDSL